MRSIEDILYPLLNFYNVLPLFIRNSIGKLYRLLPFTLRYGSFYSKYNQRIVHFQNNNSSSSKSSQNLLINQVNYAIANIPFYEQYDTIKTIEELQRLPIVDKETIAKNPARFINASLKDQGLKSNTGGSSGTPFTFLIEKGVTRPKEAAHFNWYWSQYGYKPGDKVLMVRGKSLQKNANFEYQSIKNNLVVSCYNINQKSIEEIYKEILRFKPKFIHAYPSSLLTFTKELSVFLSGQKPEFEVQALFLGSEYLFEEDKNYLNDYYNANIVTWYGHSECLIHGAKCDISGDYHFFPFYGYIELVDDNGNPINEPGIEGRIIATGFDNKVMPLIRYDTGDLGILSANKECSCGFRGTSLSRIVGRGKDFIVLKDNTKVTLTAFIFGQHHAEFSKIKEMQIVQNIPGNIVLRIIPLSDLSKMDIDNLTHRLEKSVNLNMLSVNVEMVEFCEKTHRGKHKLLIQNIKI